LELQNGRHRGCIRRRLSRLLECGGSTSRREICIAADRSSQNEECCSVSRSCIAHNLSSGGEEEYQFPFSSQQNNIAAGGKAIVDLVKWGQANWP
jgi:hypothetical protein